MKLVTDKSQLAIILTQDIRVAGEHTPTGTVLPLPEGQARHLIACNKAREASKDDLRLWEEKEKKRDDEAAKKAMAAK